MTQAELDALPEIGGIGYRDNGDGTRTPFVRRDVVLDQSCMTDDEPMLVTDLRGIHWMLGYVNGQLVKRQSSLQ